MNENFIVEQTRRAQAAFLHAAFRVDREHARDLIDLLVQLRAAQKRV